MIGEYTSAGTPINLYIYPPNSDIPIARFSGSSGLSDVKYLRSDERGSIVLETSGTTAYENHQYDVYGVPSSTSTSLFRYTGQIQLKGTELYHYKARAYHPGLGRFLQTDPIGYDDGMNMYAYVGNDPVNGVDPTGTQMLDANKFANSSGLTGDMYANATQKENTQKGPIEKALGYLNKSKAFRDKNEKFSKTGAAIQITDGAGSFDPDSNTVLWNPTDANAHENGINSPAVTLSHEIGHAVRFAENPTAFMKETEWPYFDGAYHVSQEEYRNLPFEQAVARQLGEPVRPAYLGVTGRTVSSPTFSCFSGSPGCN